MGEYLRKRVVSFPAIFSSSLVKSVRITEDGIQVERFLFDDINVEKSAIHEVKLKRYQVQTRYFSYTVDILCIKHRDGVVKLNLSGQFSDFDQYADLLSDVSKLHPVEVGDYRAITKKIDACLLVMLAVAFLLFFT
jgi:hypothetical protein